MNKVARMLTISLMTLSIAVVPLLASPQIAYADDNCGTDTFFDWGCSSSSDNPIYDVLTEILNWLAAGTVVAVVIGVVYGAIMYASSGGNQANAKKGIDIIRNAIIALVLYFAMYAGLNFLIPGGLFT